MNIRTAISRQFEGNPVAIALLLIARRSWNWLTSSVMAVSLKAPQLRLGPGSRILGGHLISFGKNIYAGRNLWIEAVTSYQSQRFQPHITVGDHVCFSDDVHISSTISISIGNHTLFGSKVYVSDHNHGIYKGSGQSRPEEPPANRRLGGSGPVVIGENVWIGENAVILGPATIGSGAVVGANSVVRGMVPANTIVAGAPAKPVRIFNTETGSWDKP